MQFHANNPARAKRIAKVLRNLLAESGHSVSLPSCQNAIARMYGFAHWHEMVADNGRHEMSLDDHLVPNEVVEQRRRRQVEVLQAFASVSETYAEVLVAALSPTDRQVPDAWVDRLRMPYVNEGYIHAIDQDGVRGVALSRESSSEVADWVTFVVVDTPEGIKGATFEGKATTAEEAFELFASHKPSRWMVLVSEIATMLGFSDYKADVFKDFRDSSAAEARDRVKKVGDHFASIFGRDTLRTLGTSRVAMAQVIDLEWLMDDSHGTKSRLLTRWPEFFDVVKKADIFKPALSADEQITALVEGVGGVSKKDSARVSERLKACRWLGLLGNEFGLLCDMLSRLPDDRVPNDDAEAESLVRVISALRHPLKFYRWREADYLYSIATTIPGETWAEVERNYLKTGLERGMAMGIEGDHGTVNNDARAREIVDGFFLDADRITANFVYRVVEPELARRHESIRYVHEGVNKDGGVNYQIRDDSVPRGTEDRILPLSAYEQSLSHLFLDEVTFDDFVKFFEIGDPLASDGARGADLENWKPALLPKYRHLEVSELADLVETFLAEQGAVIQPLSEKSAAALADFDAAQRPPSLKMN